MERVDRLRSRLEDVDQPLVGANLEVLAGVLVLERTADHAMDGLLGRQRRRGRAARARARGRLHDLLRRGLDRRMVVGLQPDSDLVLSECCHVVLRLRALAGRVEGVPGIPALCSPCRLCYSTISVTTPEPTVRPPSRMAKRRP